MMFRGRDKPRLVEISSRFALAGLAALAVAMNGVILLVTDFIFDGAIVADHDRPDRRDVHRAVVRARRSSRRMSNDRSRDG